jgi:small GTP-binding protein
MSTITELLLTALEKQKKRFFLSAQEKEFINDVAVLLTEDLPDPMLIHNVRLRLNVLIERYNTDGKQGRMLEDFISIIIHCKIVTIKSIFKNIDVVTVEQLLKDKKFIKANRILHRLYLDEYAKISHDDSANENISKIYAQLFADENQLPVDISENILRCLAEVKDDDVNTGKDLVNASLVCRQWHKLIHTTPELTSKMKYFRLKAEKNARIKAALPGSLVSDALEHMESQAVKIFVLGTHYSGATSVLGRYMQEKFIVYTPAHIGVNFRRNNIEVCGNNYRLQIWDTNDCDNLRMSTIYMRGSALSLFVFDLANKSSYNRICRIISDLKNNLLTGEDGILPIILIGNKLDCINGRKVTYAEVSQFVDSMNLLAYFECSAKTREGIDSLFVMVEKFAHAYIRKFDQSIGMSSEKYSL